MYWIYTLAAWTVFLLVIWNIWRIAKDAVQIAKQMHQIPCADCQFFTGNYYLKCPVHPKTALTEEAICCPDYYP
jgi:hypothetical protein